MPAVFFMDYNPSNFIFSLSRALKQNRNDPLCRMIARKLVVFHGRASSPVLIQVFKIHCSAYQQLHWQCDQEWCKVIMCS